MDDTKTDQAIVLGASMAGLLAARVLSERFKRVVVIDRDVLPSVGEHRRGVPHGRHVQLSGHQLQQAARRPRSRAAWWSTPPVGAHARRPG